MTRAVYFEEGGKKICIHATTNNFYGRDHFILLYRWQGGPL